MTGITGWQLAFTPEGMPVNTTQYWMSLFCKERLIVDRQWHAALIQKEKENVNGDSRVTKK